MGKSRNMEHYFIKIANFNDAANKVVNHAIKYSGDEKCQDVNTVHMFLGILETSKIGENILKHMNTTFDMVYGSYQTLAESGRYGRLDTSNIEFNPDYFSPEVFHIIGICATRTAMTNKEASVETLLKELLDFESEILEDFFKYIGLDIKDINDARGGDFYIPDELEDFIEDVHKCKGVTEDTITNVDNYVDEMIEVLCRKKKANPCIIGEAGVGKTTIVYRLAQRIISGDVPAELKDQHIVYVNGSTLTSGTRFRGDFEERMKNIMDWASKEKVIIFLDEIHTFINAGDTGHNDGSTAGNMFKRYLSDGAIRIIGATTIREYHSSIEKDKAFNRRMQKIVITEPTVDQATEIIKNTIVDYEKFHNVKVPEELIKMLVRLSDRYIKDNFLPDKAYTVLDQACTKAKLSNKKVLDEQTVLDTISKLTKIDVTRLNANESDRLINLEKIIGENLIGQENAVKTVCKAIRRSKTGVRQGNKPIASFLFVGPTGVGKTELCKVLSKEVAMGEQSLIKIDMSEFTEKNSVSRLLGTTAGYIGYGEGGQLTEKVKHNPYSIVLLDEIEKAHPDIFNTFLQLLDEGKLTDGEGTTVDFTNCIIVMTSNAGYGADGMNKKPIGIAAQEEKVDSRKTERIALKALEETFKPEFLNRIDNVVIFEKLTKEQCHDIVGLMLKDLTARLNEQDITLSFDDSIINRVVETGYSDKYGARNLRREIQDTIEDTISDAILAKTISKGDSAKVYWADDEVKLDVKHSVKKSSRCKTKNTKMHIENNIEATYETNKIEEAEATEETKTQEKETILH